MVMTALMAAMTCIATMIIQVPSPMNGYVHLGDGLVLLAGIILGPLYGGAAAGIGSMLADLLSGYPHYAVATLIIKALAAIFGGIVYHTAKQQIKNNNLYFLPIVFAGVIGGIIVTTGYFLFAYSFLGEGLAAASSIPGNIVQNVFGIITSTVLMPILSRTPFVKELIAKEA
jgi:ECF transporter S component (folate family)